MYPSMNASYYKFGMSQPGSTYYDISPAYEIHDHSQRIDDFRRPFENSSTVINGQTATVNTEWEVNEDTTTHDDPVECKSPYLRFVSQ